MRKGKKKDITLKDLYPKRCPEKTKKENDMILKDLCVKCKMTNKKQKKSTIVFNKFSMKQH